MLVIPTCSVDLQEPKSGATLNPVVKFSEQIWALMSHFVLSHKDGRRVVNGEKYLSLNNCTELLNKQYEMRQEKWGQ